MPAIWGAVASAVIGGVGAYQSSKAAGKGQSGSQSNELDPDIKKYITGSQGVMPAAAALYGQNRPQFARFDPNEIQGQDYLANYANYLGGGGYDPNYSSGYQSPGINANPQASLRDTVSGGDGVASVDDVTAVFREYGGRDPTPYELEYYTGARSSGESAPRQRSGELINDIISPGQRDMRQAWYSGVGATPYTGQITPVAERGGQPGGPPQPPTVQQPQIPPWMLEYYAQNPAGGFPAPGGVPQGVR